MELPAFLNYLNPFSLRSMKIKQAGLILCLILSFTGFSSPSPRKGLLLQCLDMEKAEGFQVAPKIYRLADSILQAAEKRVRTIDTLQSGYPAMMMKEIHRVLEETGIVGDYSQDDPYKNLLSYSLVTKRFDCDKYTFLFLAIGERLRLPLYAVLLPSHMALQWHDAHHSFYWETTEKEEYTREDYISRFRLNKYHFHMGMYLNRMSPEELIHCSHYNIGLTQLMTGQYAEAARNLDDAKVLKGIYPFIPEMQEICKYGQCLQESEELSLESSAADSILIERAKAFIHLKGRSNLQMALTELDFVLFENPQSLEARLWQGVVYMEYYKEGIHRKKRHYGKALRNFNLVIAAQPCYDAYLYRSILQRHAMNYEEALKDIEAAGRLNETDMVWVEKGNIYFEQKNHQEAISCYNKALQLNASCFEAVLCRGFARLEMEQREEAAADFFLAYYHGKMPYEYFKKYLMEAPDPQ